MLELRFIRENLDLVIDKMKFRGMNTTGIDNFAAIDSRRRELLSESEGLRNKRKTSSQKIAELKKSGQKKGRNIVRPPADFSVDYRPFFLTFTILKMEVVPLTSFATTSSG